MKKMKRWGIAVVGTALIVSVVFDRTSNIVASEFEGNEEYWTDVCSNYISDASLINSCQEYRAYLINKRKEKLDEASKVKEQVSKVENDLVALGELAFSYKDQISEVQGKITIQEEKISEMDQTIASINTKISDQEEKIEARKESIKSRMIDIQYSMNSNEYINFIMSAEDLVDFIQRSNSVGTITDFDNAKMDELNDEIAVLAQQREELQRIKETQEAEKGVLEQEKERVVAMQIENDNLLKTLEEKKTELASQQAAASNAAANYLDLTPSGTVLLPPVIGEGGGNAANASDVANFYSGYYESPYNIISNVNLTGQCTWFVHGRVGEVFGGSYRGLIPTGNANTWYSAANLAKGPNPRAQSIIVWGNGYYGHVAYVESYDGTTIRITEGNVNAPGGGLSYGATLADGIRYSNDMTLSYSDLVSSRGQPIGFIYL